MNVKLKGVHVRMSETLKDYVTKHLVEPLQRTFQDYDAATLTIHLVDDNGPKGGLDKEVRVTVHVPSAPTLHVSERGSDLYACVNIARDRIEEAARRALERRVSRRQRAEVAPL